MAANKLRFTSFKLLKSYNFYNVNIAAQKLFYCTTKVENQKPSEDKVLGSAKFSEKKYDLLEKRETEPEQETFASLLRNSEFINLGDPVGKEVVGEIFRIVENDLYIDFGWKFPTVCPVPQHNKDLYVPGAKVKLLINDLELSTRFLGGNGDVTLLEADCLLLGLVKRPTTDGRTQRTGYVVNSFGFSMPMGSKSISRVISMYSLTEHCFRFCDT